MHRFPVLLAVGLMAWSAPSAARAEEAPAELAQARAAFERDVEFILRPARDRYLARLDAMKRTLGGRGDVRGALAVQEEIDRVRSALSAAGSGEKFAGRWFIRYENGATRKVAVDASEGVALLDEADQPIPAQKGKLVAKGGEFLLDLGDGKLERWSLTDGNLVIDHYSPKSTYPKGPVNTRGLGKRLAPK